MGTHGHGDVGTHGRGAMRTWGHMDVGLWGHTDMGTHRHGATRTWGCGDPPWTMRLTSDLAIWEPPPTTSQMYFPVSSRVTAVKWMEVTEKRTRFL